MSKVAIVGSAETTRGQAPYDDKSWEIWTLNDMMLIAPRIDRHFEMHDERLLNATAAANPGVQSEVAWLRSNDTVPVFMRQTLEWVPRSQEYPLDSIVKEFGGYLTSTMSYMLALAIYEGADEIGLWGVDCAHGSEYAEQLPSCEYFIGWARGRGIPVYIPPGSTLLACRTLYGEYNPFTADAENRIKALSEQHKGHEHQRVEEMLNLAKIEGALEMLHYFKTTYG